MDYYNFVISVSESNELVAQYFLNEQVPVDKFHDADYFLICLQTITLRWLSAVIQYQTPKTNLLCMVMIWIQCGLTLPITLHQEP